MLSRLPIDLVVNSTRFDNGRVDFSDRFIRPNYSAAAERAERHRRPPRQPHARHGHAAVQRPRRRHRAARDRRRGQPDGHAAGAGHQGQGARHRAARTVALFGASTPATRSSAASSAWTWPTRSTPTASSKPATRSSSTSSPSAPRPTAPMPPSCRCRLHRRAAAGPPWRHRPGPAGHRLGQRPAVQHGCADLEGDRQPVHQGRQFALRRRSAAAART